MSESPLIYGTMRLAASAESAEDDFAALDAAIEAGIRRFDLADIYAEGRAERRFGDWLARHPGLREELRITSKCGVCLPGVNVTDGPVRYDNSPEFLRQGVERSLERLRIDALDTFLIHRPDYLADLDETAATLDAVVTAGLTRELGVSNFTAAAVAALSARLSRPLGAHQFEFNLVETSALEDGRLAVAADLRIEAWSPLRGVVGPAVPDAREVHDSLRQTLAELAVNYTVEPAVIALAWILRHPAGIRPVIGTTRPDRIRTAGAVAGLRLTRSEWYAVLEAARGRPVP